MTGKPMTHQPAAKRTEKRTFKPVKFSGIDFRNPMDAKTRNWMVHPNAAGIWN
jgi:hypothetical protein